MKREQTDRRDDEAIWKIAEIVAAATAKKWREDHPGEAEEVLTDATGKPLTVAESERVHAWMISLGLQSAAENRNPIPNQLWDLWEKFPDKPFSLLLVDLVKMGASDDIELEPDTLRYIAAELENSQLPGRRVRARDFAAIVRLAKRLLRGTRMPAGEAEQVIAKALGFSSVDILRQRLQRAK